MQFNRPDFITNDPISIPHKFSQKHDIEIAGFLTATLAWGQRSLILKSANNLMQRMDNAPLDFIKNHTKKDLIKFRGFKYRTFNEIDCLFFIQSLQNIYKKHESLENVFIGDDIRSAILHFRNIFFSIKHPPRTQKHISSPPLKSKLNGSACKRLNMFLRWMVRDDKRGVDFGIWKNIYPKDLLCPLDIHSGNTARELGLLSRKQNDWRSVEELTSRLKRFDKNDPAKYDFTLFGLGVLKKQKALSIY